MESPKRGNRFMLFFLFFNVFASVTVVSLLQFAAALAGVSVPLTVLQISSQLFSILAPCIIYAYVVKRPLLSMLPRRRLSLTNIVLIGLMVFCIQPLSSFLSVVSSFFSGQDVQAFVVSLYSEPAPLLILAVCVVPAILEELPFRGILQTEYKDVPVFKAALINGLFFGLFHLSLEQLLYAILLGFIFTYFVHYTRSVYASVLAHFLFNFSQTALSYQGYTENLAAGKTVEEWLALPSVGERAVLLGGLGIVALLFTIVFALIFRGFIGYNKRRNALLDFKAAKASLLTEEADESEPTAAEAPFASKPVLTWSFLGVLLFYAFVMLLFWALSNQTPPELTAEFMPLS